MSLRVLIIAIVAAIVVLGLRRIWREWTGAFKADDAQRRRRDLQERARSDVVDLKRSKDGVFRPRDDERSGRD